MKERDLPIFPVVLLIAMIVGAYFLYNNLEFEEREFFSEQTDVARNNSHLAAARLLEKEGFSFSIAENRSVFSALDIDSTGVLWIENLNILSTEQEVDSIIAWIESGGVLLTSPASRTAFDESTVSGNLLDKLGLEPFGTYELNKYLERPDLIHNNDTDAFALQLPEQSESLKTMYLYSYLNPYFKDKPHDRLNIETIIDSPYLIHKRIGEGYASIYSDASMFNNYEIYELDHAYLLLWLTQPAKQKTISLVFRPAEKPGLFKVIWNRFAIAVCILGIALIGFLRWASSRLGPVEQELPPVRNNIMAHLEARGEYWYRHKHLSKISNVIQASALENLQRKKMSSAELDRATTIKQASELVKCSVVDAESALYGHANSDEEILNTSRTLQRINHRKPTIRNNQSE